jgi:alkyldihydroxyacetonephosphate synthase
MAYFRRSVPHESPTSSSSVADARSAANARVATVVDALRARLGDDAVSTTRPDREAVGRDLWPRLLLESFAGPAEGPAAVVWPRTAVEVSQVVRLCAAAGVPIVPFGAGSGVCGGARAETRGIVLDLKRMKAVRALDPEIGRVTVEAGYMGELFERRLERAGLTLGHFPSSIQCSTVGGWVAARSAGQCSSRYGKIEDMVVDLEVVTGDGEIRQTPPAGSPGLDWNGVFVGSEGTLGIITAATLRVHPAPEVRRFRGWLAPSTEAGLEIMRRTLQAGHRPAVMRLYDPLDTRMAGQKSDDAGGGESGGIQASRLKAALEGAGDADAPAARALRALLSVPRAVNLAIGALPGQSLLITVSEGGADEARTTDDAIAGFARAVRARDLGEGPGRHWFAHRHDVSYKQSRVYRAGAFVDTFEVATTWSQLPVLYRAVRRALSPHVLVMAHFSHAYPGGCSIYFTFVGSAESRETMLERYGRAWRAALDAASNCDAVLAHHHGVGLSRASHLPRAHGAARAWYTALKANLDPAGILNPGKIYGSDDPAQHGGPGGAAP